jgi:hypothetical protein
VSDFKVCVSRIRLIGEDGNDVKPVDDDTKADDSSSSSSSPSSSANEIRFSPGLIDLSSGKAVDWGKAEIPTGFKIAGLRIKVHKDKDLCGVDYSLKFNELTTPQDVEFKWKFDPAVEFTGTTEKLEVSLAEVITSLGTADLSSLKERAESSEGKCSVK